MIAGLHVIQTVPGLAERLGGPSRCVAQSAEALARAGLLVDVVTGDDGEEAVVMPDPALARTWRVASPLALSARFGAMARSGEAMSLVHDNGLWRPFHVAVARAARRRKMPRIVSPHGMLAPWALAHHAGRKRIAWHLYQRELLTSAEALVATAQSERAAIQAAVPGRPVALIPNGVVVPVAAPRRAVDPDRVRTVLFMSRLHAAKNLPGLIEAWTLLEAAGAARGWRLRIAGPDEDGHRAEIERRIAAAGLSARVGVEDPVPEREKGAALAAADLFVLPSFSENFGIVVAEALAHGVPVVATTGAPWRELLDQRCGWWTDPAPAALAQALGEALGMDDAERAAMGTRGRALVTERYSWTRIAERTAALYRWVALGGERPAFVDP